MFLKFTSALLSKLYGDMEVTLAKAVLRASEMKRTIVIVVIKTRLIMMMTMVLMMMTMRHLQMDGQGTHLITRRPTRAGKC